MMHSHSFFVLGILFLTIVAPLWISAHYGTRWRKSHGISREDEKTLAELLESARRIERRVEGLEKLLDVQAPGWRQTP
jgi:phage shock protein B